MIAKSEASFVNTQVITDKIQEQMKMGRDGDGIRSEASAEATARHSQAAASGQLLAETLIGNNHSEVWHGGKSNQFKSDVKGHAFKYKVNKTSHGSCVN